MAGGAAAPARAPAQRHLFLPNRHVLAHTGEDLLQHFCGPPPPADAC